MRKIKCYEYDFRDYVHNNLLSSELNEGPISYSVTFLWTGNAYQRQTL